MKKLTEKEASELIRERHSYLEYICGFDGYRSSVTVKDKRCGHTYTEVYDSLRNVHEVKCRVCREIKRWRRRRKKAPASLYVKRKEKIQREKKDLAREKARAGRKAERARKEQERLAERQAKLIVIECPVCGKSFQKKVSHHLYCSERCRKRVEHQKKEVRRRRKISMNYADDISLDQLIKRDNNTCYLCGKQCDKSNAEWIDGVFYAYDNYPSIDHVIPIANGGTHTWDNVMLAHRICNSLKRDRSLEDVAI